MGDWLLSKMPNAGGIWGKIHSGRQGRGEGAMSERPRKSKYSESIYAAINAFWRIHHYPPTIRDIVRLSNMKSTSDVKRIVCGFDDVRIDRGRIIPVWVDRIFENAQ